MISIHSQSQELVQQKSDIKEEFSKSQDVSGNFGFKMKGHENSQISE